MNEDKFRDWLVDKVNTQAPLSSYPIAIKKYIPQKLEELEEGKYDNLFDCVDINYLKSLKQRLLNNGDLHQFNIDIQSRLPSAAIQKYIDFLEDKNSEHKTMQNSIKNIILYGSPGVGKTHNVNKLIELIEEGKTDREFFESIKNNTYNSDMNNLELDTEERVRFITFHQSFGYEDFIEGFRPNEDGKIELINGIFKTLAIDANENYVNSILYDKYAKQIKEKEALFDLFVESIQEEIDSKGKYFLNELVYIFDIDSDSFRYKGENWQNSQKMKFKDIQLLNQFHAYTRKSIKDVPNISGLAKQHATYYSLLVNKLYEFLQKTSQKDLLDSFVKEEEKNYYIVIDEINRGNISKIFGELITLIEEDKRGILDITLPYSKDKFRIPKNLYIIGTMNSTDKSIALIDIALRRRFTFLKMEPNLSLVKDDKARSIMKKLNQKITDTLGSDYLLGHSYFMKIQNEDDLEFVLEYKIKPLLEEYFYGDENGLKEILQLL